MLAAAYTQRAWMVYKVSKTGLPAQTTTTKTTAAEKCNLEASEESRVDLPSELLDLDTEALEAWAARDFEMGARYGNVVAAEMAKATNPYARLCGAFVGEVMRRELGCQGADGEGE